MHGAKIERIERDKTTRTGEYTNRGWSGGRE